MSLMMSLVREAVIDGFLVAKAKRKAENLKRAAMFYIAAAFLMLPMICFLFFAGYLALSEQMTSPVYAALAIAGALFVLAIIFMIAAKLSLKRRGREMRVIDDKFKSLTESATAFFDRQVKRPIRLNPKKSLLAATVLGLLTARRYL